MAKDNFQETAVLVDPTEKIVQGVITTRETPDGPKFSFALLRDFVRDGQNARTPWMSAKHIAGIRRVLDMIEAWYATQRRGK